MARSGADVVVAHLKTTAGGLVGLKATSGLASAFRTVRTIFASARRVAPAVLCFAHGGPLATPRETARLYRETGATGFVAASSVERLATEAAVIAQTRAFKAQRLAARTGRDASRRTSRRAR